MSVKSKMTFKKIIKIEKHNFDSYMIIFIINNSLSDAIFIFIYDIIMFFAACLMNAY